MVLAWEGWGNQNPHGEEASKPAPLDFHKMLWAQQVRAAGQREQTAPHCTSPGPGQAGICELGTPSHGLQEDVEELLGGDSLLPSIPESFCFVKDPWHALNSQKSHQEWRRQERVILCRIPSPENQGFHLWLQLFLSGCAVSSQIPTTTSATTSPPTHQCYSERRWILVLEGVVLGFFSVYKNPSISLCL